MRLSRIAALALFAVTAASLCYAAECGVRKGENVTLLSDPSDPDVIVWDSRERLTSYTAGRWNSSREVMAHTLIAGPGTHALVTDCTPADTRDAIGIRIVSGPLKGKYGWVISSDVHTAFHRAAIH